jgi:hypothetical protein
MQSWQTGKRAWSTLAVVLAASWVGACDADDTGLFSNDAPLSPTGGSGGSGSGGSSMAAATAGSGMGGGRPPPPSAAGGAGQSEVDGDEVDGPALPDGDDPIDGLPPELPPEAPDVTFKDNNCDAFVPCGGTLAGSWVYSDACIDEGDLGLDLRDDGCEAVAASVEATVSGGLSFTGSRVERQGVGSGSGELRIPNLCTLAIGGCNGLRALIDNDDDACEQDGTDCLCGFATEELAWDEDTYQVSGGTFTLGSGRTFDYCVEGNTLTYRETSVDVSPQDAALHVLTRQ